MPPPKHAIYYVYDEQVNLGIQFTPFETHLTPVIDVEHKELVVKIISVQAFTLQVLKLVSHRHIPSVPSTHPAYTEYDEHTLNDMQAVPEVVHLVLAENAEHPA